MPAAAQEERVNGGMGRQASEQSITLELGMNAAAGCVTNTVTLLSESNGRSSQGREQLRSELRTPIDSGCMLGVEDVKAAAS
jgi:hypothetical protein